MEKYNKKLKALLGDSKKPVLIKITQDRNTEYQYAKYRVSWILLYREDFGEYVTATILKTNSEERDRYSTIAVKKGDFITLDNRLVLDKQNNFLKFF